MKRINTYKNTARAICMPLGLVSIILMFCIHTVGATDERDQAANMLVVPVGYSDQFEPIPSDRQKLLTKNLNKIPAMMPQQQPLTIRNALTQINKRLLEERLGWRVVVEIKSALGTKDTAVDDPFKGQFPSSVDEYLDGPITKINGRQVPASQIKSTVAVMSLVDLIYFAATSQQLGVLWLTNNKIVITNCKYVD